MSRNSKNTFSITQKKAAVESLKEDFSTANFTQVAKKIGCSLITIRNWAERHGTYTRRTQKPSKPKAPEKEPELLLDVDTVSAMAEELKELQPLMVEIKDAEKRLEEMQKFLTERKKIYITRQSEIKKNLGL